MSSIAEVAAKLRAIADRLSLPLVHQADDDMREAAELMSLATHMEVKLAIRMHDEGRTEETVVIDREVCGRRPRDRHQPITCDRLLSWFLPEGAQLTVVEQDATVVTY